APAVTPFLASEVWMRPTVFEMPDMDDATHDSHGDHAQSDAHEEDSAHAHDDSMMLGGNHAVYLHLENQGDTADRLIGGRTEAASSVEVHESVIDENDIARMNAIDGLAIAAGETLRFETASYHL